MAEEKRNESQEPTGAEDAQPEDTPAQEEAAPAGEAPPSEEAPEQAAAEQAPSQEAPPEQAGDEQAPPEQAGEQEAPPEQAGEQPVAEEAGGEEAPEEAAPEEAAAREAARQERPRRGRKRDEKQEEVIPGAHLEPDLVLEEEGREEGVPGEYAGAEVAYEVEEVPEPEVPAEEREPEPVAREPLDLAADARYAATGKRKSAVARVVLKPGEGVYTINGRHLDQFFPRIKLQRMAMQPLETAGYQSRMDVVAKIHGGGVSAQAGALRHGIARALVEADPNLRLELKRRGFLTRDPRVKERKKAGLKKARKRPQFSKR
jgi:small subunit ribosomal protein S9